MGRAGPVWPPAGQRLEHGLSALPGATGTPSPALRVAQRRTAPGDNPRGRETKLREGRLEAEARADPDDARAQDLVDATEGRGIDLAVHLQHGVPVEDVERLRAESHGRPAELDVLGQAQV